MSSTTTPQACVDGACHKRGSVNSNQGILTSRAFVWPTNPAASAFAVPSELRPSPLICEWGAIRDERAVEAEDGGGRALCATGVEEVDGFDDILERVGAKRDSRPWYYAVQGALRRCEGR